MATAGSNIPCTICGLVQRNELRYGEWLTKSRISVHYFCLLFSTKLLQNGKEKSGLRRFLLRDISKLAKSIGANRCDYCHKISASVYCKHATCTRIFHLICGIENNCLLEFCNSYDTYCSDHYPPATKSYGPDERWQCDICNEDLAEFQLVHTIPSCCGRGWYHVDCIRQYAFTAGYYCSCPNCRHTDQYRDMVQRLGVYVPQHEAQWETKTNYATMKLNRRCEALNCAYERTKEYRRNQILLCDHCGAYGMHQKCARAHFETPVDNEFTCAQCAEMVQTRHEETMVDGEYSLDNEDDEDDVFNCAFYEGTDSASGSVAGPNPPTVGDAELAKTVVVSTPVQKQYTTQEQQVDQLKLCKEQDDSRNYNEAMKLKRRCQEPNCAYERTNEYRRNQILLCDHCDAYGIHQKRARAHFETPVDNEFTCAQCAEMVQTRHEETMVDGEYSLDNEDDEDDVFNCAFNEGTDSASGSVAETNVIDQLKLNLEQEDYRDYRLNYWLTHE